jgi:hypothetical protein
LKYLEGVGEDALTSTRSHRKLLISTELAHLRGLERFRKVWGGIGSMGCCLSTQSKGKRRRQHVKSHFKKRRGGSRGSAHFVIPVSGSSLGSAAQKYQVGKNAKKDMAHGGTGNAFLIERPIASTNGAANGHSHLQNNHEHGSQNPVYGSPSSKGYLRKKLLSVFHA